MQWRLTALSSERSLQWVMHALTFVADVPKHQALRRRVFARRRTIARLEHLRDPFWLAPSKANCHQRTHNGAHHRVEKGIALHRDNHQVFTPRISARNVDAEHIAHG